MDTLVVQRMGKASRICDLSRKASNTYLTRHTVSRPPTSKYFFCSHYIEPNRYRCPRDAPGVHRVKTFGGFVLSVRAILNRIQVQQSAEVA